nr:PREDICTED: disease resistance protein RML1B-like isoform X2 [Daucus carota subsp. sativus]
MAKEASFCHVFLSFKGETRNNFTCFLYEALKADGFIAFMDKSDICVGDELNSTIMEGIRSSMSAIIVFSQTYAESTWCLDELVLILERYKVSRYFILPIFYEVEIHDIKHQLGNYGIALEKHRARHNHKVEKWREALVEVGNIFGEQVEGANNGGGVYKSLRKILESGNVVYEVRNCSDEPMYVSELKELLGKKKVRLPTVIVNGKDLCGEEEVEGFYDIEMKQELKGILKAIYWNQYLGKKIMKKERKRYIFKMQFEWIISALCTFKTQCKCNVSGDAEQRPRFTAVGEDFLFTFVPPVSNRFLSDV